MNPDQTKQILDYLDKIGQKLGVGTQMIWPWFVQQIYIDAVIAWVYFVVCGVATVLAFYYSKKYWSEFSTRDLEPLLITVCVVSSAFLFISSLILITDGLRWLNPQYWALRALLNSVK